jgi:cell fate regulator YaaT (PSP1 superfamily)
MYNVVGVRFKQAGKVYYFDPDDLAIKTGDGVIVETARGVEYGEVIAGPKEVPESKLTAPLKKVMRIATEADLVQLRENEAKEEKAFQTGAEKITKHQLVMKLVDVEYTFDRNKIIFYFTADGRVDFRELVKDLASVFKTRIELRQIGVRDEAKMLGGLGPCGRPLCCSTFLGDFEPVSIKMAKEQNLSLNPAKISGICSRLMCCLKFESAMYREARAELPLIGGKVRCEGQVAKIVATHPEKESLTILFEDGTKKDVVLADLDELLLENGECAASCESCPRQEAEAASEAAPEPQADPAGEYKDGERTKW